MDLLAACLTAPQTWIIIGISFIAVELFVGGLFALPVGVSALGMADLIYADALRWISVAPVPASWKEVLMVFAVLALATVAFRVQLLSKQDRAV